jgi:hypothetical protein
MMSIFSLAITLVQDASFFTLHSRRQTTFCEARRIAMHSRCSRLTHDGELYGNDVVLIFAMIYLPYHDMVAYFDRTMIACGTTPLLDHAQDYKREHGAWT